MVGILPGGEALARRGDYPRAVFELIAEQVVALGVRLGMALLPSSICTECRTMVLRPDPAVKAVHERHGRDLRTSAAAIMNRLGAESLTDEEFDRHFGHL